MLVNLKEILEPAREQHYAVGHFNTLNVEMARAVIRAAERGHKSSRGGRCAGHPGNRRETAGYMPD